MTETDADKLRKEVRDVVIHTALSEIASGCLQACYDGFFEIGALSDEEAGNIVNDELQRIAEAIRSMK